MLYYVSLRLSVLCNALLRSTVLYLDALRCAALCVCCAVLGSPVSVLCYAVPGEALLYFTRCARPYCAYFTMLYCMTIRLSPAALREALNRSLTKPTP